MDANIKDAITKIEEMADKKTVIREIDGRHYIIKDDTYTEIFSAIPKLPDCATFTSLDGLVQMIQQELAEITAHCEVAEILYISVETPDRVMVWTGLDEYNRRANVYKAVCKFARNWHGASWFEHEEAMIALRSQFIENEGTGYLLDFLARISDDNSVQSDDNGMTQTVQVRKGISLAAREAVRPIVKLKPYRTFLEVEQPESDFLVRVREGMEIGIIEADGGMWEIEARRNVAAYLRNELMGLIEAGKVVVSL